MMHTGPPTVMAVKISNLKIQDGGQPPSKNEKMAIPTQRFDRRTLKFAW